MLLCPGCLYALNVGPIVCIKPIEGVPALALLSQLFWTLGLPPDSRWIVAKILDTRKPFGSMPLASNALTTDSRQRETPVPCGPSSPPPGGLSNGPSVFLIQSNMPPTWRLIKVWSGLLRSFKGLLSPPLLAPLSRTPKSRNVAALEIWRPAYWWYWPLPP